MGVYKVEACDRCGDEKQVPWGGSVTPNDKFMADLHFNLQNSYQDNDVYPSNHQAYKICDSCVESFKEWFKSPEQTWAPHF